MPNQTKSAEARLSPEEFVVQAIVNLRDLKYGKGIHSIYSGFTAAFHMYFSDTVDLRDVLYNMRTKEIIAIFPACGGVRLYLRGDLTPKVLERHDENWKNRDKERFAKNNAHRHSLGKILKG